jgi:hypothetical protein
MPTYCGGQVVACHHALVIFSLDHPKRIATHTSIISSYDTLPIINKDCQMSRYNMQPTGTTDIINILATEITGRSPSA